MNRIEEAYTRTAPRMIRLAYVLTNDSEAAKDLTQDAFVRCMGRFQHLRDANAFEAYIRRTVINLAKNHVRRVIRHRAVVASIAPIHENPEAIAASDELTIGKLMAQLPYRQRAAIALRYYEDLSERQTADALDCSVSAVKNLVARGMKELREGMGRADSD